MRMAAQLCDYTINHLIVYFQPMDFMECELYFNKAFYLKAQEKQVIGIV